MMKFLGKLRGNGTLICGEGQIGAADYELDGYTTRPGEVVASGELRMPAAELRRAHGRHDLQLYTADGHVLRLRFSGRLSDNGGGAAHIDVTEGLPPAAKWRH